MGGLYLFFSIAGEGGNATAAEEEEKKGYFLSIILGATSTLLSPLIPTPILALKVL